LEKSNPFHFNNLESPPPKDDLYQVWLKLAQWFLREVENVKVYRQTDAGHPTTGDQNSSLELSAQVS
jgi:hypothetical protein